jgi:hypothetical protein
MWDNRSGAWLSGFAQSRADLFAGFILPGVLFDGFGNVVVEQRLLRWRTGDR